MKSTKTKKPAKAKAGTMRMKDLRPRKDARGGAQKKEDPDMDRIRPS